MGPAGDAAPLLSGCTATLLAHHTAYVPFLGGHFPLGIANENVLLWGFAGPAPALGVSQVSLHGVARTRSPAGLCGVSRVCTGLGSR